MTYKVIMPELYIPAQRFAVLETEDLVFDTEKR